MLECDIGWGFTCYGVDADALDPEAFRWRQLSAKLVLHNLVVPHVAALWVRQTLWHLDHPKREKLSWLSPRVYLRGSLHSLKLGAAALVGPPLTKIVQAVLRDQPEVVLFHMFWRVTECGLNSSCQTRTCALSNWSLSMSQVQTIVPVRPGKEQQHYHMNVFTQHKPTSK